MQIHVIAGLFFYVIAGLDPAIQVNNKANLLIWIPGSSPGMTIKNQEQQVCYPVRVSYKSFHSGLFCSIKAFFHPLE